MFIKNINHYTKELITAIGKIKFDERGITEINDDNFAIRLLKLDGYSMVDKDGNNINEHMKHETTAIPARVAVEFKLPERVEGEEVLQADVVTMDTAFTITAERQAEYDAAVKFMNTISNSNEEVKAWAAEKGITVEATKRTEIKVEVLTKLFPEFVK